MSDKKKVLILCTANSARSQMAEGLLKHICQDQYEISSAGTKATEVRPEATKVMSELFIDITKHSSKSVEEFAEVEIDYVLTVCDDAKENCPYFPASTTQTHHSFDDPAAVEGDADARLDAFRKVRDEINQYFADEYLEIIGWQAPELEDKE